MQNEQVCIPVPADVRTAIIDALYRFGAGQDLHDRALFESAFAPDAVLDFTQPARRLGVSLAPFTGRAQIVDAIVASTRALDTTHTVTNPRITAYDGTSATLFALVEAQHVPSDDHARHLLLKNIYFVDVVRRETGWVIRRMTIENVWMHGDGAVLFPPAA